MKHIILTLLIIFFPLLFSNPQTLKHYSDWEKSIICLQGATDSSEIFWEKMRTGEISWQEYTNLTVSKSRDIRYHGTAIFVENDSNYYLITARHVLFDSLKAGYYIRSELAKLDKSWRYEESKKRIIDYGLNKIFSIVYFVPTLREAKKNIKLYDLPFLMNLGVGPSDIGYYTFSAIDLDIAVISLRDHFREFADNLLTLGYEPLPFSVFRDEPTSIGTEVFTMGFPNINSLLKNLPANPWYASTLMMQSYAFGKISQLDSNLPYFKADLSVYPGNSGGPIIENDQIVGIVNAQPLLGSQHIPFAICIKAKFIKEIFNQQIKKDKLDKDYSRGFR